MLIIVYKSIFRKKFNLYTCICVGDHWGEVNTDELTKDLQGAFVVDISVFNFDFLYELSTGECFFWNSSSDDSIYNEKKKSLN